MTVIVPADMEHPARPTSPRVCFSCLGLDQICVYSCSEPRRVDCPAFRSVRLDRWCTSSCKTEAGTLWTRCHVAGSRSAVCADHAVFAKSHRLVLRKQDQASLSFHHTGMWGLGRFPSKCIKLADWVEAILPGLQGHCCGSRDLL